ncbi:G-protein coupled receptor Mth2 [Elysia marginata]|uniref:G-protein coupled receptor Mth2 n=1 Tax=Elysia marginata TaxID=1093978 RepID=A0AAV4GTL5_9GAST|nr:G-protein coupled receptor Mth2 [Elysia marginata]
MPMGYPLAFPGPMYTSLSKENSIMKWPGGTVEASVDFQLNFCAKFCVNDTELVVTDDDADCMKSTCVPCYCLKPWCYFYDLCCPDRDDDDPEASKIHAGDPYYSTPKGDGSRDHGSASEDQSVKDFKKVMVRDRNVHMSICQGGRLVNRHCPAGFTDEDIKKKCEQDVNAPTTKMLTRVTDRNTTASFYNAFCAVCNGFEEVDLTAWSVEISCEHFQKVYSATDQESFFQLSLHPDSACRLVHTPPRGLLTGPRCSPWWFNNVVTSCNVTERWDEPDEELRGLCENTPRELTYRITYETFTFSNVFCFMCNYPPMTKYQEPCTSNFAGDTIYIPKYSSPFSLLLGTAGSNKAPSQTKKNLLENIEVECTQGKLLENNTCFTPIDEIRGLAYRMFVFYMPFYEGEPINVVSNSPNLTDDHDILFSFGLSVSSKFEEFVGDFMSRSLLELKVGQIHLPSEQSDKTKLGTVIPLLYFDAKFISTVFYSRDETEKNLSAAFFFEHLHYRRYAFNLTFQPIIPLADEKLGSQCFDEVWYPQQVRCHEIQLRTSFPFGNGLEDSALIPLTPSVTCPFVRFNASAYEIPRDRSNMTRAGNITLELLGHMVELGGNWTDMNLVVEDYRKRELKVCYSLLKHKVKSLTVSNVAKASVFDKVRNYFNLVCISVSMLCLVLTLVTYLSFRVLRSAAGINNMFLCFSLLAALAFLLASLYMRPADPLCKVVGVTTHFLWLNMFCWAVVCCFHMFQTFTSKTRSGAPTDREKILSYVKKFLFCTITPMAVIAIIMITSNLTKGDGSIGYGRYSCYLDSQLLAVFGMVTPLSLMVIANIIFFVVTVSKIRSVRKLQGNMDVTPGAPKDIYVYVKLSSLTGGFWILAVAAEYLDSLPLKIASDVFIGLQGAFIFWSYVCNERVRNLYRKAFGMTVVITSRTGTITRIARDVQKAEKTGQ